MTKIKTSELTGPALDWAVERAKGTFWSDNGYFVHKAPKLTEFDSKTPAYSTDPAQAWPIIEREGICLDHYDGKWDARMPKGYWSARHPTALVAAMRCFVASKLGDEIEIPEELK